MAEPRLATAFWVQAYLRRLSLFDIPAYVVAHGDDTAGSLRVKMAVLDGTARIFERRYDLMTDRLSWDEVFAGPEAEADAVLRRARDTDPDLWIVEVEDRQGRHLLDQEGL